MGLQAAAAAADRDLARVGERAAAIGARLRMASRPGQGMVVSVRVRM
jgi:signal transduction histidine kinase